MGGQGVWFGALLVLQCLTCALAVVPGPPGGPSPIAYTSRDVEWVNKMAAEAKALADVPSSCVPGSTILLTMSNGYHWNLLDLSLDKIQDQKCFFDRYFVITIDTDADAKCRAHPSIQHCYRYHTELAPSDWKKADYYSIVYIKIKAMKAILEQGLPVFFFDTDLIFFKVPPFPPPDTYDLAHQMEHFDMQCELRSGVQGGLYEAANKSCRGHGINTGQFGLWPSPETIRLLELTYQCGVQSTTPGSRGPPTGTQDCMNGVVKKMPRLRTLKLPSYFGGHCWTRGLLSKLQLVTYHANCISKEFEKRRVLLDVAKKGRVRELNEW